MRFQRHGVFLGLSSGFDSGAINLALAALGKLHFAYTILAGEDVAVLEQRLSQTQQHAEGNLVLFSESSFSEEQAFLANATEPFYYKARDGQKVYVSTDFASAGLSWICRETRKRGILIYLSGSGADEYISDYGERGEKIYPHSNFGGLFPPQLADIFPWHSFFLGTQRDYLMKEELIAGTHGVEGRYPFLDRDVVQEYLWLAPSVKNSKYKVVLDDWFAREKYPFVAGKTGFNPHWNLRESGRVEVHQIFGKEQERRDRWKRDEEKHAKNYGGEGAVNLPDGAATSAESVAAPGGDGRSLEEELLRRRVEEDGAKSVSAASGARIDVAATDFALSPFFQKQHEQQLVTQAQCAEKLRVNFQQICQTPVDQFGNGELAQLENARQDMALIWSNLQEEQQHLVEESKKLELAAKKEQEKFDQIKAELQAQQHEQSLLMRAGTMHLLMMRLIRLEAAADRAPLAITAGLQSRVSTDVQVVTCVSGGTNLNVSDFPVYKLFVGTLVTQGVGVLNLCENLEWAGMPMRLGRYKEYLEEMAKEGRPWCWFRRRGFFCCPKERRPDHLWWS